VLLHFFKQCLMCFLRSYLEAHKRIKL